MLLFDLKVQLNIGYKEQCVTNLHVLISECYSQNSEWVMAFFTSCNTQRIDPFRLFLVLTDNSLRCTLPCFLWVLLESFSLLEDIFWNGKHDHGYGKDILVVWLQSQSIDSSSYAEYVLILPTISILCTALRLSKGWIENLSTTSEISGVLSLILTWVL